MGQIGMLKFNGKSTSDLGLIVQFIPSYTFPEREYETLHIPGRNGDLIIDKGSFQNVEKTYSIAKVFKPGEKFISSANSIVSWLHSANGYARLEDSYEPDYYRMAMYKSDGEMNNYYDEATAIEITFECKPQRWLKAGEEQIISKNGTSLVLKNPTSFDASPVLKFTAPTTGDVTITVGDNTMKLISIGDGETHTIIIDCENMECYDPNNNKLYNSKLQLVSGSFPVLKGNINTEIEISNATDLSVQPRWWTL